MRKKLRIILFQKKIIGEILNYFANAKYFLDSNNIRVATGITAETHPKIYQNMQSLYSDFLNIYKNSVLLKYHSIKESFGFMIKFSKMINDLSMFDNDEDQFFESLKISDLKEELQAIDSLSDSEIIKIISPQESSGFNNHKDENDKQINIIFTRLLRMAEVNIFKINNILTFIRENYPVTNQNYKKREMLTNIDINDYLKKNGWENSQRAKFNLCLYFWIKNWKRI